MASSTTVLPESHQWSPSDAVAQGIAQDYSSQWHILEQLKSSVAVQDQFADSSKTSRDFAGPGSNSDEKNAQNDKAETSETKKKEKEWFILPDAPSSGHASDTGSDSALEISELRNERSYFHSSDRTTPSSHTKTMEQTKGNENKGDPYQEQWHALEELKASVKAMQWNSNISESSLDISRQPTPSGDRSNKDDFSEPLKRSPVANSNLVSGSVSSFGNTGDESSFQSGVSSKAELSVASNLGGNSSFQGQHLQTSIFNASNPSLFQGPAISTDMHQGQGLSTSHNTSSELSLESENLGFSDLPNRPATIGNYGASDVVNAPPFSMNGLPLQSMNLQVNTSQNIITVPSTLSFSGTSESAALMSRGSDPLLSKAPISARERLQPDGRDGSEVLAAPRTAQAVPSLVSYPLSAGSSTDNTSGTAPQPSIGNSNVDSSNNSNLSQVGQLLVSDAQESPYSPPQVSGALPVTSGALGMSYSSNTSVGLSLSNVMGNYTTDIVPQLSTETQMFGTEDSNQHGPKFHSLQSSFSLEQFKGSQPSLLPRQQGASLSKDHSVMSRGASANTGSTTGWLSGRVIPTSQALIHLPTGTTNQGMGSYAQNEIREAVMQRIEAHTQITDFGSKDEPKSTTSTSFLERGASYLSPKRTGSSGTYGYLEARVRGGDTRFLGNGQEIPSSAVPAILNRPQNSLSEAPRGFSRQGITTSYSHITQGIPPVSSILDRQTASNRHDVSSSQVERNTLYNGGSNNLYGLTVTGTSHGTAKVPSSNHDMLSRPSALDNIRSSLVNNENDEQSPVSKLLGPNFKATQEYLHKLKNEKLNESSLGSSFGSTGSSENEVRISTGGRAHKPVDKGLEKRESLKQVSPAFSSNSSSDNSYERKFESKQAWSVNTSDLSESRSDKEELRKDADQSFKQQDYFDRQHLNGAQDTSNAARVSSPQDIRSTSALSSYNQNILTAVSSDIKSDNHSYINSSELDSFPPSQSEVVREKQNSLSRYETPLSSLQPDNKAWIQDGGLNALNKRTLYSTESNSLLSSHDEAEDTDDLLSYEAVLEGDIKYIRQLKDRKQENKLSKRSSRKENFHSSSINSKSNLTTETTPGLLRGDFSSINGSGDRDPLKRIPVSTGSSSSGFPSIDEETRRFHLSLGAGIVSPVVASDNENYQGTPEGPSDVFPKSEDDDAELSSDGIDIEDIEEQEIIHNTSERESLTTESSTWSMYQPYIPIALRQPVSGDRESQITANSSSTYGVYDIRNSSGPGSTNRRRKAMGLSPIPGRVPKVSNDVIYVSPESSPVQSSMQEEVSTDETSKDDTLTSQSRNESLNDVHEKHATSPRYSSQERRRPGSRERSNSRHPTEDRDALKKRPSKEKEESFRSRSRGSSFEEAKVIDDYIGGRKLVQHGKPRHSRRKPEPQPNESPSLKEYSTSTKNEGVNQMWERFQESLKSSPRFNKSDSVSSQLSRLSALLSKPLDLPTTSSETEFDGERFRKPRSHSYASSSSEVSTESDQFCNEYVRNFSLSRQIKLRKLLETVKVADVPTFPRLRHRDTMTTTTASSSTLSDTSVSETPATSRNVSLVTLPRSNRGFRKVSKTPVLVPSSQSRRPVEHDFSRPKCICAIHHEKPLEPSLAVPVVHDQRFPQKPRKVDVAVNVPSPKIHKRVRKREGFVDVGVQTITDSEEELYVQDIRIKDKKHHRNHIHKDVVRVDSDKPTATDSTPKRKERYIASQNYPIDKHESITDTSLRSSGLENTTQNDSNFKKPLIKEKVQSRQRKERPTASQNSPVSKSNSDSQHSPSGPTWFYPMTNRHYSQPARPSSLPNKHSKPNLQSSLVKPDRLRFDEQTTKAFSPPAAAPSTSMQKLSLQEAFFFANPDFMKRSRARLTRIEHNRVLRENGESKAKGETRVSKKEIPASKPPLDPRTEKLHRPKPRQISKTEMKKMNLRLYNNLPEVKAQKAEDRRTSFFKTNRLRAKLYDKRVRESLKKRYAA